MNDADLSELFVSCKFLSLSPTVSHAKERVIKKGVFL